MPSREFDVHEELDQLLQGLRVLLPGVQVFFAFLLAAAFSNGFPETTDPQRVAFFISITAVAIGAVLLMAPSVQHRILFPYEDAEALLRTATRYTIIGTGFVGVALVSGIYLVLDFIFGPPLSVATCVLLAVAVAAVWYVRPLADRRKLAD